MNIVHLIAQFAALANAHGLTVHHSQGPAGWVLWVQPRHGMSRAIAGLLANHGHLIEWEGWRQQ